MRKEQITKLRTLAGLKLPFGGTHYRFVRDYYHISITDPDYSLSDDEAWIIDRLYEHWQRQFFPQPSESEG